eukprot:PITA_04152
MEKVVEEYEDIFTSPTRVPLHCQVKHSIDMTPGASLPNGPIYHHSILEDDEIRSQIQEFLQKCHIHLSSSPYGSPIVLVQKKDMTWKLCIDYQELNKIIVRNRYPIPWINDLLDQLKGGKYFNKIDLKSRYHQVPIEPSDVWKTTFKAKESLFEWLVLKTLRQHKLCANSEKCTFGMTQVQYLGYITDERRVHVDLAKIQVIRDWPYPTTLTKLRSFLGLANFYRKFVLGFSHNTWPLSQVTKAGVKEKLFWSESQQKAYTELKHCLYSAPVLALPNLQQPFEVEIDASNYAIGAVRT